MRSICVLAAILGCAAPRSDHELVSPFARVHGTGAATAEPLPPLPPPIVDLEPDSYYSDAAHSVTDPTRKAAHDAAVAPLRDYYRAISRLANRYVRTREPAVAAAVLDGLAAWADAGALLGKLSQQGEYQRAWTLAALALGYLQVRDAPGLDPGKRKRVTVWLAALARAVIATRSNTDTKRDDFVNNHRYWSGLAVGAAGIAANDRELFAWAIDAYDKFVSEEHDGVLPREARRGARALHYHLFALEALEPLAELAAANGVDLRARNGALARLVGHVLDGLVDRRVFGDSQDVGDTLAANESAWLAIEYAHTRDPRIPPLLAKGEPVDPLLGGDAKLLYSR
jgi:poly(beta-D-mannuronate) lyase